MKNLYLMKKATPTFEQILLSFQYAFDLRTVFEDFLTMAMCALTQNPQTGKSHYEDLYMETIAKYATHKLRFEFPNLFAYLISEMEGRVYGNNGNDVLGEFYENHLYRKGMQQYFTPWPICAFMAKAAVGKTIESHPDQPLRILEPACGSGRMLLAANKEIGPRHEYYAVDMDITCVKMAALNFFLNGMFHSEVMCGNFLMPDEFNISYKLSFLPLGIFRIEKKEDSTLWQMLNHSLHGKTRAPTEDEKTNPNLFKDPTQLKFF